MASSFERYQKRKLISSYFSVILSIFLVLFLLGTLGLFIMNSEKISNNFRETIPMSVYFNDKATSSDLDQFLKEMQSAAYVKDVHYVSKDSAAKSHQDIIGEDFLHFLGFNPLENSFDIHLKGDYVVADSIKKIELEFKNNDLISDTVYDKQLVELVNENIKTITFWMLVISGFLAVVAMLLINSSLRLLIFSSRFIIKTMQMVGATKSFIRRPFIWHSMKLGIIGSLLAIAGVFGVSYYLDLKFPSLGLGFQEDYMPILFISAGIFIVGIIITSISTFFATQRFLNLKSDELY
ncbi:ABC transporter permease [Flavobacterium sp. NKUCC04_CG]|uniref:cell division protein FtsX n=1 Tax=Flavobacterium sp. NKUCC04_CG TaxID=2842121 RepID=UPI001C5A81AE|nr:permease-like cell division protein FtsX [Flavobacterium sp. NKUCC04_CG]MBW3518245.1 permease-like cell division protein FtsX [Flavobacterium sp. NKUCC04_CG]